MASTYGLCFVLLDLSLIRLGFRTSRQCMNDLACVYVYNGSASTPECACVRVLVCNVRKFSILGGSLIKAGLKPSGKIALHFRSSCSDNSVLYKTFV